MKRYLTRLSFGAIAGGVIGFSYYYFIGCEGSCPITGSPYISTAYGVLAGILVAFPSKIKNEKSETE